MWKSALIMVVCMLTGACGSGGGGGGSAGNNDSSKASTGPVSDSAKAVEGDLDVTGASRAAPGPTIGAFEAG